jgi:Ca-activated chloride channel homolog
MDILWPGFIALLGLVPLIIIAYIWMLKRRRRFAVRFSSLTLIHAALPRYSRLRRHLPFALFMLALTSLILALSRPVTIVSVPTNQTTIILAMDVSRSMLASDIPPSRIEAAKAAALAFIQNQRPNTHIGIVAFAGFSEMVQPPTTDQEALFAAIESLTTGRGTAIGSGILKSLDVIAEIDPDVAPPTFDQAAESAIIPVPKGAYVADIIVVLTDGVTTTGPAPLDAAQQSVARGVRIYTIGFGTENGTGSFDPGQQSNNGRFRRGIDEETLKQIAEMTGGAYYVAESASELQGVLQNLPTYLITKHETLEVTVVFTAIGVLIALIAIGLAQRWHPFP